MIVENSQLRKNLFLLFINDFANSNSKNSTGIYRVEFKNVPQQKVQFFTSDLIKKTNKKKIKSFARNCSFCCGKFNRTL